MPHDLGGGRGRWSRVFAGGLGNFVFIDAIFSSSHGRGRAALPHCPDERQPQSSGGTQVTDGVVARGLVWSSPSCVLVHVAGHIHGRVCSALSGASGSLLPPLPFHRWRQGTALQQRFLPAWPSSPNPHTLSFTFHVPLPAFFWTEQILHPGTCNGSQSVPAKPFTSRS